MYITSELQLKVNYKDKIWTSLPNFSYTIHFSVYNINFQLQVTCMHDLGQSFLKSSIDSVPTLKKMSYTKHNIF